MSTQQTETVAMTIDAPPSRLSEDLANPGSHLEWATEFFAGEAVDQGDGTWSMNVPRMGGPVIFRTKGATELGVIDMYIAPVGAPFGPPLPVRVIPNGDGADVLFTLARIPGQTDEEWNEGIASMRRELLNLKARHES